MSEPAKLSTAQERKMQLANQQVAEIKRRLELKKEEIRFLLADDQQAMKLVMSALMRASDDEKVRECEPNSIVRSVIQAALCGADISAGLGEGYLVPYFNKDLGVKECQFMPGYRLGQRRIHEATGLRVVSDVRCTHDHWRYSQVPLVLEHTPAETGERGELILSYAAALDDAGRVRFAQIATARDIEEAKKASRKGRESDGPAWKSWEDRMWRKVAIMRLAKEVRAWNPTAQLDRMLEAEDAAHNGMRASIGDIPAPRVLPPSEPVAGVHGFGRKKLADPAKSEASVEEDTKEEREPAPVERARREAPKEAQGEEGVEW